MKANLLKPVVTSKAAAAAAALGGLGGCLKTQSLTQAKAQEMYKMQGILKADLNLQLEGEAFVLDGDAIVPLTTTRSPSMCNSFSFVLLQAFLVPKNGFP